MLDPLPRKQREPAGADKKYKNSRNTSRGVDKRERILTAGARVLAARRYVDTTLVEIAELSGTQPGSLYYYFDSREDLIIEVLTRGVQDSIERVTALIEELPDETTSLERLQLAIITHLKYMVESEFARAGVRGVGEVPPEISEKVYPHWREYGEYFARLFLDAAADGYIAQDVDVHALRMLIFGATNWALEWYNPKGRLSIDGLGDIVLRMLSGVTQEPPGEARSLRPADGSSKIHSEASDATQLPEVPAAAADAETRRDLAARSSSRIRSAST